MYVVSSLVFYTELASSSVVDGAWFRESVSRVEVLIFLAVKSDFYSMLFTEFHSKYKLLSACNKDV